MARKSQRGKFIILPPPLVDHVVVSRGGRDGADGCHGSLGASTPMGAMSSSPVVGASHGSSTTDVSRSP
eukprot:5380604-Amphidinium_carterae.1